ncbi:metallophosphoesterase family protein [Candidatus Woesearchaeota archaeon]|nr:metallophosphoesterase family protein [Candidatus Woesearchaeota archaeon]
MNAQNIGLEEFPFLVVSDVHARPDLLERILNDAPDVRYKVFLGDAVGYGDKPVEAIHMLSSFDIGIRGNHDAYVLGEDVTQRLSHKAKHSLELHATQLGQAEHDLLAEYATPHFTRDRMIMFHGSPTSHRTYLLNEDHVQRVFKQYPFHNLLFGGHLHVPRVAVQNRESGQITFEEVSIPLSRHFLDLSQNRYLINCPSVIQGRFHYLTSGYVTLFHESADNKILNFHFIS